MPTTSRRSWLSAFLLALVAPWWPRPATAKPAPAEDEVQSYNYDRTEGLAPAEEEFDVIYTYDHLGRLTEVQCLAPR